MWEMSGLFTVKVPSCRLPYFCSSSYHFQIMLIGFHARMIRNLFLLLRIFSHYVSSNIQLNSLLLMCTGLSRQQSGSTTFQIAIPRTEHADAEAAALILINLCQIAPALASVCREALVNTRSLPELALQITVEILHDELEFLSRLVFSRETTSQWILHHVGAKQKLGESLAVSEHKIARWGVSDSNRHKEKEGSVARIRDALLADARRIWQEDGWGGRLHAHLRLYCVLVRAGELSPTHEEVCFTLIFCKSQYHHIGGKFSFTSSIFIFRNDNYIWHVASMCF